MHMDSFGSIQNIALLSHSNNKRYTIMKADLFFMFFIAWYYAFLNGYVFIWFKQLGKFI